MTKKLSEIIRLKAGTSKLREIIRGLEAATCSWGRGKMCIILLKFPETNKENILQVIDVFV